MRPALLYTLLVIGLVAFLTFFNNTHRISQTLHRRSGPGRRLVVRTGHSANRSEINSVSFDPIVADLEQRQEDLEWEREYIKYHHSDLLNHSDKAWREENNYSPRDAASATWDELQSHQEYEETEDYLNDEFRFNISHRLSVLFPLVDVNPRDGFISLAELEDWQVVQALKRLVHRTDRELETYDTNKDGLITLKEYLSHLTDEELGNNNKEHGEAGWWKEQFELADEDGDGALNHTEFNNFLHPEDSKNEKLLHWMRKEKIRERDEDKDGKLNFEEFHHGIFEIIRHYAEYEHRLEVSNEHELSSQERFDKLDKNNDGFLTEDELDPILHKLHPGEVSYAKYQAWYLMHQVDANKDGHLTLEEMLDNPYAFYHSVYGDDEEDDEYAHDEFR